ncbi:endoribonuclease XendoU, partial [Ancylostoma duodenale]
FFTKVNDSFLSKPSFKRFIALTDNFYRETGIQEPRVSVREEQEEINAFLDEILKSGPWQLLYKFLNEKKHPFAKDPVTFRKTMYQLWFWHYSRAKGKLTLPDLSMCSLE